MKAILKWIYHALNNVLFIILRKKTLVNPLNLDLKIENHASERLIGYFNQNVALKNGLPRQSVKDSILEISVGDQLVGETLIWNYQQGCLLFCHAVLPKYIHLTMKNDVICSNYISYGNEQVIQYPVIGASTNFRYLISASINQVSKANKDYFFQTLKYNEQISNKEILILKANTGSYYVHKRLEILNIIPRLDLDNTHVNHAIFTVSESHCAFFIRTDKSGSRIHYLVIVNCEDGEITLCRKFKMISHICFVGDCEIFGFMDPGTGPGYYHYDFVKNNIYRDVFGQLKRDGHPVYDHENEIFYTDTYPQYQGYQNIFAAKRNQDPLKILSIRSRLKYRDYNRHDMHINLTHSQSTLEFNISCNNHRQTGVLNIEKVTDIL